MLKDITLGQFFPGNSLIHRLDPRVKITISTLYIVVLFIAQGLIPYILLTSFVAVAALISKIKPKMLFRGMKPVIFVIIITMIFNVFYNHAGRVLFSWWIFTVTDEGLTTAAYMIVRILLLITASFVMLTYTTSPIALTDGLENLLSPLKKIHLPVHELAMMMTIALRFIPTLIEETDKIMSAQRSRGADFESGNLIRRAKSLIPILVPLFISAFRRADELAVAMECRGYRGDVGRTRLKQLKMTVSDYLSFAVFILVSAAALVLTFFPIV